MVTQKKYLVPTWWEQESFSEFKTEYSKKDNSLLFFIGSGISRWMNLPDWKGLLLSLANYYESNTSESIKAEVEKRLGDVKNNPSKYQELGTFIKHKFDSNADSKLWRNALNDILNNQSIIDTPSQIHNVIAQLNWFRIVTPNYDQLIELAMHRLETEVKFEVTHPWKTINNPDIERCKDPCIFKIHGDITDPQSEIVLTKEDYDELYTKDKDPNVFKRTLGDVLRSANTILFMGYSHDDPYLKDLYKYELIETNKSKIFALVERSGKDFEDKINKLSKELEIKFISYGGGENHSELLDFLNYFVDPEATEERYRRLVTIKKPTVIMLHCGGTIGAKPKASTDNTLTPIKIESRYDEQLTEFSEQLLSWYNETYNSGNDLDIEIIWEILPKEFQMLSENATPLLWNEMRKKIESIIFKYFEAPEISENKPHLSNEKLKKLFDEESDQYSIASENNEDELSYKRFSSEFKNRYILGIVILFGTDTLAYLAPALSFSLQHLPCPIVITGANQSPKEPDKLKESALFATSDTWKNLKMSLYFLQCFGHRTREIFVCFGNTVHNCVNLRKRAKEIVPSGRSLPTDPFLEPFTYRNVSPHYQYMFKFIDGIFCNNYYTNNYVGMMTLGAGDIRHIRHDALEANPTNKTIGDDFYPVVQSVVVTPSFPLIDVKGMLSNHKRRDKLRAFLVEGYPSGTYPTCLENNFSHLLIELYNKGIPVILVSRYGILATQQKYETIPLLNGTEVSVLPLYGLIAETALPLISMVIGQIPGKEWKMTGTPRKILADRIKLVKQKLADFFSLRPDIISEELKYVITDKMSSQLEHHYEELAKVDNNRKNVIEMRKVNFPILPLRKHENDFSEFITISHNDFKLLLNEFTRPFEQVGAGPDGFEILYNLGFDIGISIFNSFKQKKTARKSILFSDRESEEQLEMIEEVNYKLKKVSKLLRQSRVADVDVINKMSVAPPNNSTKTSTYASSFSFEVAVQRPKKEREGEKYNVMTFTDAESDFFKKLRYGFDNGKDINTFIKGLKEDYKKLLTGTWENSSEAVDWLILGIYKSIACEIARYLRFDKTAVESLRIGDLNYLRQAVKVNIKEGNQDNFSVQFSYFEKPAPDETD